MVTATAEPNEEYSFLTEIYSNTDTDPQNLLSLVSHESVTLRQTTYRL